MAARQGGRGGRAKGRLLVQVTHLQAGQYLISKHLPFFCPGVTLLHLESAAPVLLPGSEDTNHSRPPVLASVALRGRLTHVSESAFLLLICPVFV